MAVEIFCSITDRIMLAGGARCARPTSLPSSSTIVPLAPGPVRWQTSPSQLHFSMPPVKLALSAASSAGRRSAIDDFAAGVSIVRSLMAAKATTGQPGRRTSPRPREDAAVPRALAAAPCPSRRRLRRAPSPGPRARHPPCRTGPRHRGASRARRSPRIARRRLAALLVSALLAPAGLAAEPAPAGKPEKPDLFAQSVKAAQEAVEEYGYYDNPKELERVNRIGYELVKQADYDRYPVSFGLVDMPVPNAFALPGGQIFVTRGLLDLAPDDDMLANVLGHELTHVTHEHYVKMQRRATLMNVLGNAL